MKNVGTVDAYWRVSGGLLLVALGSAAMVRRPSVTSALLVAVGSLKVAEGVTRFDPMMDALGWTTLERDPLSKLEASTASAVDWAGTAARSAGEAANSSGSAVQRVANRTADKVAEAAGKGANTMDKAAETAERVAKRAEEYLS